MDNEVDAMKQEMDKKFNSMKDNTEEIFPEKEMKFAKLNMPAELVDFLFEHYGFFDLVEMNTICFYIMKTLGNMEKDGFKFAIVRQNGDKVESYQLDFHELIGNIRIQLAQQMSKEKEKNV